MTEKRCINLIDLSTETLIYILQYCDLNDLFQLYKTCNRFHQIIETATNFYNGHILVTNQLKAAMRNRSLLLLNIRDKIRISNKWRNGDFTETVFYKEHKTVFPCLSLKKDLLWSSKKNIICAYKRNTNKHLVRNPMHKIALEGGADFWKFVHKNDCLLAGIDNGDILLVTPNKQSRIIRNAHVKDVYTVDLNGELFASGSKDGAVKIWSYNSHNHTLLNAFDLTNSVRSIEFAKDGERLAVGTDGRTIPPLNIIDVKSGSICARLAPSNSTLHRIHHLKWETRHVLLTAGYDGYVRRWDLRTGGCETYWLDPLVSGVFCFETDELWTLLTGTENCGRVVLWDMRQKTALQMYLLGGCRHNSPIYSLSFDATNLFAASDRNLMVLNFTRNSSGRKNYSMFCNWKKKIIV